MASLYRFFHNAKQLCRGLQEIAYMHNDRQWTVEYVHFIACHRANVPLDVMNGAVLSGMLIRVRQFWVRTADVLTMRYWVSD